MLPKKLLDVRQFESQLSTKLWNRNHLKIYFNTDNYCWRKSIFYLKIETYSLEEGVD